MTRIPVLLETDDVSLGLVHQELRDSSSRTESRQECVGVETKRVDVPGNVQMRRTDRGRILRGSWIDRIGGRSGVSGRVDAVFGLFPGRLPPLYLRSCGGCGYQGLNCMLVDRNVLFKRRRRHIHGMPLLHGTLVFQQTLQFLLLFLKINVVLGRFHSFRCNTGDYSGPGEVEGVCGRFQR